jgi:hypothetical protein
MSFQLVVLTDNPCIDNLIAQNVLVKQLQKHDLNVVATSDGNEALAGTFVLIHDDTLLYCMIRMAKTRARLF